jgi:hypothetical protein
MIEKRDGKVLLFADVPNAGTATVSATQRSGNKAHDSRSGKFAPGGGRKRKPSEAPAQTDPIQYAKMLDAVKDAARQFDIQSSEDIKEFLAGRAADPESVDLENFMAQVTEQRINDVVDLLHSKLGGKGDIVVKAGRRITNRILANMTPEQRATIEQRLLARGHDQKAVDKLLPDKQESS